MEPVIFPKAIVPVRQTDRVKRSTPREDSGSGSRFSRHLREQQANPPDVFDSQEESAGQRRGPAAPESSDEGAPAPPSSGCGDEAFKKLIDIRV